MRLFPETGAGPAPLSGVCGALPEARNPVDERYTDVPARGCVSAAVAATATGAGPASARRCAASSEVIGGGAGGLDRRRLGEAGGADPWHAGCAWLVVADATRHGCASASKSVAAPRSVTNAMVLPSGDQDGSRSAYLSFVRRCKFEPSAFTTNKSDRPPSYPVNTSCLPSGDHDGVVSPFSGTRMRRTSSSFFTSRITRSSRSRRFAAMANERPPGENEPAELMKRRL